MQNSGEFQIQENVQLSDFTTWKIGGKARYFVNADFLTLQNIVKFAKNQNLKYLILGAGSNVLIPTVGIDCLVIRYCNPKANFLVKENLVSASANLTLAMLVKVCANNGFSDLTFLAGIPGTVGGAIFMNAGIGGQNKKEISDVLDSVIVLDDAGNEKILSAKSLNFSYRYSDLQTTNDIVLSANFNLQTKDSPDNILKNIKQIVAQRRIKEPENRRNCGSVFKSHNGVAAAIYIDKAGLKGLKVNDAMVSFKHANWIENLGSATSDDVLILIEKIKSKVFEKFGVVLQEEVRMFGF